MLLAQPTQDIESSNYAKFQTSNPVVRRLINRFYAHLELIIAELAPSSVLDAGCGEGETLARLRRRLPSQLSAIDLNPEATVFTAQRLPGVDVSCASVYEMPFNDSAFDLVLCLEVLEHLRDPAAAVGELTRVSSNAIVVSVPHEPWFRLGSLLRGKYLRGFGNHPEHINHWGRRSLAALLGTRLELISLTHSFPWLIGSARVP